MSGPERMQSGDALTQAALALLHAEMQALAALMPGQGLPRRNDAQTETATDAAIEADFDNLPV